MKVSALVDTGATAYLLINASFAELLSKRMGAPIDALKRPVPVKGYDGNRGTPVTHSIRLTLHIGGRTFIRAPFLLINMARDIILGNHWLADHDIGVRSSCRQLLWPKNFPPTLNFARTILISRTSLQSSTPDLDPQNNVLRRNALHPELSVVSLPPPSFHSKHEWDVRRQMRELYAQVQEISPKVSFKVLPAEPEPSASSTFAEQKSRFLKENASRKNCQAIAEGSPADITAITAEAFRLHTRRRDNIAFTTSIHEINSLIDSRFQDASDMELKQLKERVPADYHDFLKVFSKHESDKLPTHSTYDHRIEIPLDAQLRTSPIYNMSTEELLVVKEYLIDNLKKGFIEASNSPFAAPVLFVKKANGGLRFCIDFRRLNAITKRDEYPLPLIDETLARVSKARIFTKLDIRQAFHRIRMHPDSEDLTTFRTRYGTYKCKVLPFGLTNGPATYQRYMNDVLFDLLDVTCTAYLDDILIYSENENEHKLHVLEVLSRLKKAGLQADIDKCEFSVKRTKYLGFILTTDGVEVDPDKISVIKDWKPPTHVRGVQSFLGFCNFYRRFIKDYGRIARPLVLLTRKDAPFLFDTNCMTSFEKLKNMLINAPVLVHYQTHLPSMIETDASDGVVGGVLSQLQDDGQWHPVAFFTKTMLPAEMNYAIFDKEMLAIIKAFKHWRPELTGAPHCIRVLTDHKSLEYFMTKKTLNQRQAGWAEILSSFWFEIAYRSGVSNTCADALSRRDQEVTTQEEIKSKYRTQTLLPDSVLDSRITDDLSMEGEEIASLLSIDQEELDLIDRLLLANREHPTLQDQRDLATNLKKGYSLRNGLLLYKDRLVVPDTDNLRTALVDEIHTQISSAHPGRNKTELLVRARYYWKGIPTFVKQYVENCTKCHNYQVPRDKTPGFLHPLPIPSRPWADVSMDFKSFPPDKQGFDHVFIVIDRLSKQSICIPCLKTTTAKEMAMMYIHNIYRWKGAPMTITSDRGPQFISNFWNEFSRILGVKLKLSTAYHPQTDGQTEIMNQYLDQRLRPYINYFQDDWSDLLPMMDYAQLTLPHESLGMSPFELQNGYLPSTSFDWTRSVPSTITEKLAHADAQTFAKRMHRAWGVAKAIIKKAQDKKARDVDSHRRAVNFDVGDYVYVTTKNFLTDRPSKKLDLQMAGPYQILEKVGHSYKVDLPASMKVHKIFSPDKLRKASNNPVPGQKQDPPPPISIAGDAEYEVQEILDSKLSYGRLRYKVKWVGYDDDSNWYYCTDVMYSPHKIRDFHIRYPVAKGPPKDLPAWIQAWEEGIDNYDHLADDKPMDPATRKNFLTLFLTRKPKNP